MLYAGSRRALMAAPAGPPILYNFVRGIYRGPELVVARASPAYIDDSAGNWTLVPANTLRRSDKGALIEGAQTNIIRNNSMQGAVAGGAFPTNWGLNAGSGTASVVGLGTEGGTEYIDIRFTGPAGSTFRISPEASISVSAAANQLFTGSSFLKVVSGSLAPFGGSIQTRIVDIAPATLAKVENFTPTSAALTTQRAIISKTLDAATTSFRYDVYTSNSASGAYDITLRIGWPQLEQWAAGVTTVGGASSPIRTTGTAATRAADVPTSTLANALAAGTVAIVFQPSVRTLGGGLVQIGPASDRIVLRRSTGDPTQVQYVDVVGGAAVGSLLTAAGSIAENTRYAIAGAWAPGDMALSLMGATPSTAAPATTPTGQTALSIGVGLNGYIERLAIWPYRVANSNLQVYSTIQGLQGLN